MKQNDKTSFNMACCFVPNVKIFIFTSNQTDVHVQNKINGIMEEEIQYLLNLMNLYEQSIQDCHNFFHHELDDIDDMSQQ